MEELIEKINAYKMTDYIDIADMIKEWINFSNNNEGRNPDLLKCYDIKWKELKNTILENIVLLDEKPYLLTKSQNRFLRMVSKIMHIGPLYRYHKNYDDKEENFGVMFHGSYVSFTKNDTYKKMYGLKGYTNLLQISCLANEFDFGFDLVGYYEFMKHEFNFDEYALGTPAILNEKEVVFPLDPIYLKGYSIVG